MDVVVRLRKLARHERESWTCSSPQPTGLHQILLSPVAHRGEVGGVSSRGDSRLCACSHLDLVGGAAKADEKAVGTKSRKKVG